MQRLQGSGSVEMWAGAVWLAIGLCALALPALLPTPPGNALASLAEILLCAPMSVWLGWLAAQALATGSWPTTGDAVSLDGAPRQFALYLAIAVLVAGAFLAGFVRGVLSIAALL